MEFQFRADAIANNQLYTLASYVTASDGDALIFGGYKDSGSEHLFLQIGASTAFLNYEYGRDL